MRTLIAAALCLALSAAAAQERAGAAEWED